MGESENNEDPMWYKASIITLARRQSCTTRNSCAEQTQGSSKLPCAAAQGHAHSPGNWEQFGGSQVSSHQVGLACKKSYTAVLLAQPADTAGLQAARADPAPPCSKTAQFPATSQPGGVHIPCAFHRVFTYPIFTPPHSDKIYLFLDLLMGNGSFDSFLWPLTRASHQAQEGKEGGVTKLLLSLLPGTQIIFSSHFHFPNYIHLLLVLSYETTYE